MDKITIENGWLLDQDLKDSRVIDGNEVRLFRGGAILAYLDGVYEKATFDGPNPIRIENDEGKILGYANVQIKNRKLVAEVILEYASPERLAAETRDGVRHYVRVDGMLDTESRYDDLLDFHRLAVTKIRILRLVLSPDRPTDPRIQALGEPIIL